MLSLAISSTAMVSEDGSEVGHQLCGGHGFVAMSTHLLRLYHLPVWEGPFPPLPCNCLGVASTQASLDPGEGQKG